MADTLNDYTGAAPVNNGGTATPAVIKGLTTVTSGAPGSMQTGNGCIECGGQNTGRGISPGQQAGGQGLPPTSTPPNKNGSSNNNNSNNNNNNKKSTMETKTTPVQARRYTSWRNYPVLPPIVLTGTVAGATTSMFFTDSNGFFTTFGGTAGGQAFTVPAGNGTIASLHGFLQTMWIYVRAFNVSSTQTSTLNNNLQQIPTDPDGLNKPIVISSSANISNQQFNPNLINNCYAFVLTFADALKIATSGINGEVVNMTLVPGAVGFYGSDLDDFINTNPSFASGAPINCN